MKSIMILTLYLSLLAYPILGIVWIVYQVACLGQAIDAELGYTMYSHLIK